MRPAVLERPWVPYAALTVPFLVAIAALRGLTVALPMFHGSDELVYHYPTILRFSRQLPFPDLAHYAAAQTPLFHLLLAYAGKVVGYELWRLRLIEALVSYLLGVAIFRLLRSRLGMDTLQALALSLLFVLSPYVYAASFRLMTDNLALLFSVVAIERLERFRETRRLGPYVVAAACCAAAVLTRQSTAFVFGVAALYALAAGGIPRRDRELAVAGLVLAAAPLAALFLTWHGLTPPGGNTSSCGLCASSSSVKGAGLRLQTAELALAAIGAYGAVLFAPSVRWREPRRAAIAALAAAVLLLISPATPHIHSRPVVLTAGFLWNAAAHTPKLDGTPLLFWLLVALGGAVLYWRYRVTERRFLMVVLLACFLVSTLVIRLSWQKYVDPYALLLLLASARPAELAVRWRLGGALALALGFIAYTLSFVV